MTRGPNFGLRREILGEWDIAAFRSVLRMLVGNKYLSSLSITVTTKDAEATNSHNSRRYNLARRPSCKPISFNQAQTP